jgi:adenine deaminase
MKNFVKGNLIDLHKRRIYGAEVMFENGVITSITETNESYDRFIMPGFTDAHVHIESSMATPLSFGKAAIAHGTIATVSDPHEIANVLGADGIEAMIRDAEKSPVKIFFGAPSCVPATPFETSGATINAKEVAALMKRDDILFLSEMMNYPGVLNGDAEVMAKIKAAQDNNKPVDGHAPGLNGDSARKYAAAGITTDHETYSIENALDKIEAGMYIQIREGSAAKNFDELIPLMHEHPDMLMFCSDDLHPDDLLHGHINLLVKKALSLGYDFFDVLTVACINPVNHYRIPVGLLRVGDAADFIVVENPDRFTVLEAYSNGKRVFPFGDNDTTEAATIAGNNFQAKKISTSDLKVEAPDKGKIHVIGAEDGSLLTKKLVMTPTITDGIVTTDTSKDILKMVVLNRYEYASPAVAFINGFGLKEGALATSVAHDSHNIIAIGVDDHDIALAVNTIVDSMGGICTVKDNKVLDKLALPFGGLMSDKELREIARAFKKNNDNAKNMGSSFENPFITASFMSLLVIPSLKLSDKGLFDSEQFSFLSLFISG